MNELAVIDDESLRKQDGGILAVAPERWQKAQDWERQLWKRANRPLRNVAKRFLQRVGLRKSEVGDDWNHWWAEKFNGYEFVPEKIENAIEFGCGPYTNLRIISAGRRIAHAYCSDPLLHTYLEFRYTWLSESYRKRRVLVDDHPMEQAPFASSFFDLVIVVNVLDHVCDATQSLRQAVRVIKPGGLLILGQDLTGEEDLKLPSVREDIGHPIRISHQTLEVFTSQLFDPIIHCMLSRDQGREPRAHYGTFLFAGIKR